MKHLLHKLSSMRLLMLLAVLLGMSGAAWADVYQKVTSESDLEYGKKYIIVCESANKALGSINTYGSGVGVTINNNELTLLSDANVLTLQGSLTGGWILVSSLSGNNLSWNSGNSLNTSSTDFKWTIKFDSDNNVLIASKDTPSRVIKWNASSPRFACYTSSQTSIQLYKKVESSSVATTTTIDATGITNTDVYASTAAGSLSATVVDEDDNAVSGAIVTWSGSDDAVATIDASTGAVTLVAAGTVTFTATYAGVQDEYSSSSDTYEMTVTDSTPVPTHTATFFVNGTTSSEDFEEGAAIGFPGNPDDVNDKKFVGWVTEAISGVTDTAPSFVTSATMGQSDVTYYAVFATVVGSASSVTDELTNATTGVTGSAYSEWSGKTVTSDAVYAGQSAGGNSSIQLRSNNNNSGVITTTSGGKATKVVVVWNSNTSNGRTINIYGSNTAYSAATDLYGNNAGTLLGTIVCGTSTELTISDEYAYIGIRSASSALYLDKISITWSSGSATISGYCTTVAADTRKDAELAFSVSEANAGVGQDFTAPTLSTAEGFDGTVEYESSDENVAQLMDSETGELRIVGEGIATITATFAGNDDFKAGSASYTLTVTDNRIATTTTQENIVLDINDIATLTRLAPVVKDANENVVAYQYDEWPTEMSFEIVSDENYLIGSLDNNTGEILLNEGLGTATLKAYYNYFNANGTYKPSECTFTITVESPLNGIAAFCELTSGSTGTVRLTDAVVLYANGNDMFVRDNTGAIDFYNTGLDYTAGKVLNGKITAKYSLYNNMPELTTPISNNTLVATDGTGVAPTEITTSEAADNACNLVKLSGVTVTSSNNKFYVDDVQVYDKFKLNYTIEAGKTYNIVGIMVPYNSIYEICPTEAPTEVVVATPTITLEQYEYNLNANGGDAELPVTCTNMPTDPQLAVVFCDANGDDQDFTGAPITYDWITASINNNGNIDGHIDANTGDARTAYFKVSGVDANNNTIYSEVVTVNQAASAGPSITFEDASINFDAGGESDRKISFEYESLGGTPSFEVEFFEQDGETAASYAWVTSATIEDNKVNLTVAANDGAARMAYFKVHAIGTVVYSNLVTINQAAFVVDYATLPFEWAGGSKSDLLAETGVTAYGLGSDYAASNAPYLVKLDGTGDYIQVKTDSQPGKVTIGVKMIGGADTSKITVQESSNGTDFTDVQELTISGTQNSILSLETTNAFAETTRYVRLYFTKGSNVGVGPITITKMTPSITIDPAVVNVNAVVGSEAITSSITTVGLAGDWQDLRIQYYNANGDEISKPDWFGMTFIHHEELVLDIQDNTSSEARTGYLKLYGVDANNNTIYSNLVTVNQAGFVASITIDPAVVNVNAVVGSEAITSTITTVGLAGDWQDLRIQYYNANGDEISKPDWFGMTFIHHEELVLDIQDNTSSEARTGYLKLYGVDANNNTIYSNLVTVNQAGLVVDYATLPFRWVGGASVDFTALNGVTANGLGSDYATSNAPYLIKFDTTGDYINVKTDAQPSKVIIGVKMLGGSNTSTITVQESADGETFSYVQELTIEGSQNDVLTLKTTETFDASTRYIRLTFTKGSNVGVGPITITKDFTDPIYARVNAYGYATYCSEYPLDFSYTDGYTAWSITAIANDGTITFSKITGAIDAAQGVLLYDKDAESNGTGAHDVILTPTASGTELSVNLLVGAWYPTSVKAHTVYGLSGSNFVINNAEGTIPAGKAYIKATDIPAEVKSFTFVFEDETTGITETRQATREEVESIFNLGGQRMSKVQRGINIVNGKKVFVR